MVMPRRKRSEKEGRAEGAGRQDKRAGSACRWAARRATLSSRHFALPPTVGVQHAAPGDGVCSSGGGGCRVAGRCERPACCFGSTGFTTHSLAALLSLSAPTRVDVEAHKGGALSGRQLVGVALVDAQLGQLCVWRGGGRGGHAVDGEGAGCMADAQGGGVLSRNSEHRAAPQRPPSTARTRRSMMRAKRRPPFWSAGQSRLNSASSLCAWGARGGERGRRLAVCLHQW